MPVGRISRSLAQAERSRQGLIVAPTENPMYVGSRGFTPANIDGLYGLWDVRSVNKNVGDLVSVLPDSIKHYDLTTGLGQPSLVYDAGMPFLKFSGAQSLKTALPVLPAAPYTVFCVCRKNVIGSGNEKIINIKSDGATSVYWALATQAYASGVGGNNSASPNIGSVYNRRVMFITVFNDTASLVRVNGVQTTTWNPSTPQLAGVDCISMGANFNNSEPCNDMLVGVAGFYTKALNSQEIAQLEAWLLKNWTPQ